MDFFVLYHFESNWKAKLESGYSYMLKYSIITVCLPFVDKGLSSNSVTFSKQGRLFKMCTYWREP